MEPRKQRCSARSSQTGKPCQRWAIKGGTVCPAHGGSAGQVKRSARERLDALVDPAIAALAKAIDEGDVGEIIKASQIVLDRTGYGPKSELTGAGGGPIIHRIERVVIDPAKDSDAG